MRRYLFWAYYIDPIGYTFSGLMENEFGKLDVRGYRTVLVTTSSANVGLFFLSYR